jgi:uncharacterized protein YbcI
MPHMDINQQTTELSSYISKLLRDNFGRGPESVHVSIGSTFAVIYFRNFISPTEKVLMEQKKESIVQTTRDTVVEMLVPEIKANIKMVTGMDIREEYYDWDLHNKSGVLVGIASSSSLVGPCVEEQYQGKEAIHDEIRNVTRHAEKVPEELYSCRLNQRTVIVLRKGLLVSIEKQLIRQGLEEQLRIAKRQLEKGLLHNNNHFERIFNQKVMDIFVDWDFQMDKSIIVFILNPKADVEV